MTEIDEYLTTNGERMNEVDWSGRPWSGARAALAWLGLAPTERCVDTHEPLEESDARAICQHFLNRFTDDEGRLVWSSYALGTALESVAESVVGAPEVFLKVVWDSFAGRELEKDVYEFSRALGLKLR
ncbi:MAG: hypothetical protein AAFU79_36650, partial [Myxococcota bacterium]